MGLLKPEDRVVPAIPRLWHHRVGAPLVQAWGASWALKPPLQDALLPSPLLLAEEVEGIDGPQVQHFGLRPVRLLQGQWLIKQGGRG